MTVSILGCGWFGKALGIHLIGMGYQVKGSTTSIEKLETLNLAGIQSYLLKIDETSPVPGDSEFWNCDALIIASNVKLLENVGYLNGLEDLVRIVDVKNIKRVIFVSSISVYGEPNQSVDENSMPQPATSSAEHLLKLEASIKKIKEAQTTLLRFGGLVGPGRMPGSFLAGRKDIPNGLAPVNLIHLSDCIGIMEFLLTATNLPDCLNAVSPDHPTRAAYYTMAARMQGLDLPTFVLENRAWKIVRSKYQTYKYAINDWEEWLLAQKRPR